MLSAHVRGRILVVEDNRAIRDLVVLILQQSGYHVCAVGCGSEAYDVAARQEFELAIIDIGLPDIDGFEVAANLDVAGLLVSGDPASYRVRAAELPSGWQFMQKPYRIPEFLRMVALMLETPMTRQTES